MKPPCTTFVGTTNPFTGASLLKPATKRSLPDVSAMRITSDPVPPSFHRGRDKYGPLFEQLKPGQAVACKPAEVSAVAYALRKWLKAKSSECTVLSTSKFTADEGRVWMMGVKDESYSAPPADPYDVKVIKRKGKGA